MRISEKTQSKPEEDFLMVLEGMSQTVTGRIVAQVGKDPALETVYVFIKGEAGGNYLRRIGICSCCNEIEEDWTMFQSWEELKERLEERAEKLWLLKIIAGRMCGEKPELHG